MTYVSPPEDESHPKSDSEKKIEQEVKEIENTPSTHVKKSVEDIKTSDNILNHFPSIRIEKTTDDNTLVDVHVNNPLKKVIALLEEIKKQKAFSFTLKGSLGIMGVFLALSVFGIFGGGKLLCDKGLQTKVGELRVLQLTEEATDPDVPWTKAMLQRLFGLNTAATRQRLILLTNNEPPIHVTTLLIHKPEQYHRPQLS